MHHFSKSRCSSGPRDPSVLLFQVRLCRTPETSIFCSTFCRYRHHVRALWTGRHTTCRCGLFLLMVVWWGKTFCASNSLELVQPFMPLRHDLTTVPVKGIIARILGHRNWVLHGVVILLFKYRPPLQFAAMNPWTTSSSTSWPPTTHPTSSATSWIPTPTTVTAPTRPPLPWLTSTPTHYTNYIHNLWPPNTHPSQFIRRLHLVTLHIHRTTFLDNLRTFKRDYHLSRPLHPLLRHLHHLLPWPFPHIHHLRHLWLHPLCHRQQNHILHDLTFQIPMSHLPSTSHGIQPSSQRPTPSVHQCHLHLQIHTPILALPVLLHEPIAHANQKPLHPGHPLLAIQPWKQLPKSDRTALRTNLVAHNHRPIHLLLLPSQILTQCQILPLHPIKPNSPLSPLQLNNFKIHFDFFKLNMHNNNNLCMALLLHSTNDDLKTNFWLHHILPQPLRRLHQMPVHLHLIHQRRIDQLLLPPQKPTYLRQPLIVHQTLVFPNPHLHTHGKALDHARNPRPDLAVAIAQPTTVQPSVTDVHALPSFDIDPQPPIQNIDALHHHRDADHLHDIDPHHDIDGLPVTALLQIQYIVHGRLIADPGHLPAILAHPTSYSHLLIVHPIRLELRFLMMMTLGAFGTMQVIHLVQLDLFDHLPHGIIHVKCPLQKLHQVPLLREYLLGTAKTLRWMTHPCH